MRPRLNPVDRRILNRLQKNIPITEEPWEVLAEELAMEEGFLLDRIAFLKKSGVIRRISAVFFPAKAGFVSTLIAAKVSAGNIEEAVGKINSYPEVTHNYKRDGEYNIWFTLVARNKKRVEQIKSELEAYKKFDRISDFPALRLFKINVNLWV